MVESQFILKVEKKVNIIADYREKDVIDILKDFAKVQVTSLSVADYVCSENIGIERKSYDDFVSSIIDGRIFDQAKDLKDSYEKPLIIIEGFSNRKINQNSFIAAIASLFCKFSIPLIYTKNKYHTAQTIYWIAKKEQENKKGISYKIVKKKKSGKDLKEEILSSFPGINKKLATRLLKKFGNLKNVFNANEFQLKKIEGIGDNIAKNIIKILEEEYK